LKRINLLWYKLKEIDARQYFLAITGFIVLVLLFLFRNYLLLVLLLAINVASSAFLKEIRRNQIGIELVMFSTVISGVLYGPAIGAFVGGISMVIDYAFATRLSMFSIVTVPSYAAVGYVAGLVGSLVGITNLGIMLTIAYVVFSNLIIVGVLGGTLSKSLRFAITDIAFNAVMFSAVAPFVINIMS
jgi:hypothetical protein